MNGQDESPPEIPGFYWDPDRKKYFRILPNHLAPRGSSSFYTTSSTHERRSTAQSRAEEAAATALRNSRRQFPVRRDPFLRATLFREIGGFGEFGGNPGGNGAIVRRGDEVWEARKELMVKGWGGGRVLDVGVGAGEGLTCFAVAEGEGQWDEGREKRVKVMMGTGKGCVRTATYAINEERKWELRDRGNGILDMTEAITSMTLAPNEMLLVTNLGGNSRPLIFIGPPDNDNRNFLTSRAILSPYARALWCSTCLPTPPTHPSVTFAVGTSGGPYLVSSLSHGYSTQQIHCSSDVFTVEYLSASTSTATSTRSTTTNTNTPLLYGCRDGGLRLYDPRLPISTFTNLHHVSTNLHHISHGMQHHNHHPRRIESRNPFSTLETLGPHSHPRMPSPLEPASPPSFSSAGTTASPLLLHHGSLISHIHSLNHHLLIVKGPQYTALYDLRYPHPPSPRKTYGDPTRPVMVYDELSDPGGYRVDEGWAVGMNGDAMAGMVRQKTWERDGEKGSEGEVGVWSTVSGKRLYSPKGRRKEEEVSVDGGGRGTVGGDYISGMGGGFGSGSGYRKFIKFVTVNGQEEVWATRGNRIERIGSI